MSGIADTSFRKKKKVLGNYSNHLNSRQILYFHGITNQNPQREIPERFTASSAGSAVLLSTVQEISIVNSGVYLR